MVRSKALALVFLLGALLVGGTLGFTSARLLGTGRDGPGERRQEGREALADQLGLTAAQRAQLDSILDRRHRDITAVMAPVRPRLDSIRLRARGEIMKMLSDGQRAEFQRILDEQQRDSAREAGHWKRAGGHR
jgi:Spy/CpxP family protein refolding chaperone